MRAIHLISIVAALTGVAGTSAVSAPPPEVRRVLRSFDFEERRLGNPEELPMHWVKLDGQGLPHYVNGRLATDAARGGAYSFRLDLNGGSLVYRYQHGHMRVQQGAHYRIEGYCRTTSLPHARARLTAYFTDIDGRALPQTVRHSALFATAGNAGGTPAPQFTDAAPVPQVDDWHRLAIELSAEDAKAAWLVLEVALLQPELYAGATLGQRTLHPQDIRGSAWFDDIAVSQVPRVVMTTDRPGNIFRRGEAIQLQVRVDDRFTDDLAAQLVVQDAEGRRVYQRSGAMDMTKAQALGPGSKRMLLALPELPAGWYEVSLVMSSQGQTLGTQSLALIQLADAGRAVHPDGRFGFVATSLPFEGWTELPDILPMLSAGRVKLAMWGPDGDILERDASTFDGLLERLQELQITPTACLLDLPPSLGLKLRAALGASATDKTGGPVSWPALLTADPELWRPQLAYLIARHANHLDRWQLGDDGADAFVTDPKMRQAYATVYGEFARLVRSPDLAMPWPAWYEMQGEMPATIALSVPPQIVLPSQVPLYVQELGGNQQHNLSLSLQWLERERYGRDVQMRDLAQRVIYALSAGAQRVDLPLPFTVRREPDGTVVKQPQELLLVSRTLIRTLSGATFKGKVPIAEGVEAFLFDRNGEGILALWDRSAGSGAVRDLALHLGDQPVAIDLWGNATPLTPRAGSKDGRGEVRLALGAMPVFLVGIDGQLAQTRASIALDRPLIESSFQPHARRIRFTNAYQQPITGMLRLRAPRGWTLTPPTFQFSLNPGETFDKDLTIEIPYNSVAGAKTIDAEFTIQGERNSSFTVPLTVTLGLSDVGMQTIALRDGKDVIVQQTITNYGDRPINYDAFAIFPGKARQERLVTKLAPGMTTVKRYRFADVKTGGEAKVKVGVKEQEGTRILNEEVSVQ